MRYSNSLRLLSVVASMLAPSGCIDPSYPDEFEEAPAQVQVRDGSIQQPSGPFNGAVPQADASSPVTGGPTGFDAGLPPTGGGSDSGVPVGPEAGPRSEAGVPDASASQEDAGGTSVSSCTITASTDASNAFAYRGEYGCAVWIGNASNKLAKAFFVATRISGRSGLPTYRAAASGATVDVTTGATLSAPKQHQYTWKLVDATGAKVPAGSYTLNVETHSSNGVSLVTIPFDTTNAPVSAMATPKAEVRSASIMCN